MIDFFQILNHLSIGAIILDRDLKVIFWNRWITEHSMVNFEDVLGQKIKEIFPKLAPKGFLKKAREVIKSGKPAFFNNKLHRNMFPFMSVRSYLNRHLEPMEQTIILSPMKNDNGVTDSILISIFDISDWVIYQNDLLKSKAELEKLSRTDDLTQVPNRRNILNKLFEEMITHKRKKRPLSMAVIDIDHFKKFNDTFGHQCGDNILHEMAQFISGRLRDYDILGRYGGEEFLLILPETTGEQAFQVCDRLRQTLAEKVFTYDDRRLTITISIGVSCMNAGEVIAMDELFKEADRCLFIAKDDGRNKTVIKSEYCCFN
ncbi:MAG: diguanylate cyclase [Proteobacteria bacterium]|nr:diguanylate cyclase [Pseudomonadota bacterium]MBU1688783.1 diguanylate cyclase [Pseudomonadota bacterium]